MVALVNSLRDHSTLMESVEISYEELTNKIVDRIKKDKYKILSANEVSSFLKETLGGDFSTEASMTVRSMVIDHEIIDYFNEDTYVHNGRFYYSTGNWFAIKGVYNNPIEAKSKIGIQSWQDEK